MKATIVAGLTALALLAGAYGLGRRDGASAEAARQESAARSVERQLHQAAEELARKTAELAEARAARRTLITEIENETRADPSAAARVPGPDSLRRLARRWGAAH